MAELLQSCGYPAPLLASADNDGLRVFESHLARFVLRRARLSHHPALSVLTDRTGRARQENSRATTSATVIRVSLT
ncbi:hypothetical protein AB0I53_27655 [Saccharopolyspora sp. NPDC050389]|uniref:hypothetical protein n=1 Tax=Saccharopolyspora sp. NPDC050389 TaxID=3155516 RepID=UPI0033ED546C